MNYLSNGFKIHLVDNLESDIGKQDPNDLFWKSTGGLNSAYRTLSSNIVQPLYAQLQEDVYARNVD